MNVAKRTEVFGHRGFAGKYPENTMVAFVAALELGVDGLEFDVHLTRDGEVVIIHDPDLSRTTTGTGYVEDYTLADLRGLDAGAWFDPQFAGQVIPTLDELLEVVSQHRMPVKLNIELKWGRKPYEGLGEAVWHKVSAAGVSEQTIISSFNHFALRDLKRVHPESNIAILYGEALVDPWRYALFLDAKGLHPQYMCFDEHVVHESQKMGMAIRPYTVNDKSTMQALLAWGVDAIITDHPDVLLSVRDGHTNQ